MNFDLFNNFQWIRQGFDRQDSPAITEHFGLYATSPTCYLSLLARRHNFQFAELDTALYERRDLVRIRAMRYSVFLVSVDTFPALYQAYRHNEDDVKKRAEKYGGITQEVFQAVATQVEAALADKELTVKELKAALTDLSPELLANFNFILPMLNAEARTIRARVRGGWKSDQFEYARLDRWIPNLKLNSISQEQALGELARLYFRQYAPASFEDFRWWTGFKKRETEQAFAAVKPNLTEVEKNYWMLSDDASRLSSALPAEGLRLLPMWDGYLMAYKDRNRYLADKWYKHVFDKAGNATNVILLDGRVAGIWDMEEDKRRLLVKAFWFGEANPAALEAEAGLLAKAAGFEYVEIRIIQDAPPITDGGQNRFMTPLKEL